MLQFNSLDNPVWQKLFPSADKAIVSQRWDSSVSIDRSGDPDLRTLDLDLAQGFVVSAWYAIIPLLNVFGQQISIEHQLSLKHYVSFQIQKLSRDAFLALLEHRVYWERQY